jgi:hypothetical protein
MKSFFNVGFAGFAIVMMSMVCQETAAQNQQPGIRQAYAQSVQTNGAPAQPADVTKEQAAKIQANLAKLSREDRQLVEAQQYCPIMVKNRLGVMGTPVKVMVKDQPVFLCCNGCRAKALANPDRTLDSVAALKAKVADAEISASLSKLSPEDRRLAEAQGYCPIMTDNRLGVMGPPVKILIGNRPVFLCCKGCRTRALSNAEGTLAVVDQLKAKTAEEAARRAAVNTNSSNR